MMISFRIQQYDEVSSTNDLIKQAISDGEPEGLAVVARSQTDGYGRRGSHWASCAGSLYMSLLLRPECEMSKLQTLSLTTAIAVRRMLMRFVSSDATKNAIKIKWPNDVVVIGDDFMLMGEDAPPAGGDPARVGNNFVFNKICGISVEQKAGAVCVGIGVNIKRGSSTDPKLKQGKNRPVYLCDIVKPSRTPSIGDVRDELLAQFAQVYDEWLADGFEPFRAEFLDGFALDGFKIRIDNEGATPVYCKVLDISASGHLIVLPEGSGEVRDIASGTVTIVESLD